MAQESRQSIFDFGQPFDFNHGRENYVFVDGKNGRLYLSSDAAKKLGHGDGFPFSMWVQFLNGNIGLTSREFTQQPARFDKRRYSSARSFIKRLSVPSGKYIYYDFGNGWHVFRPEKEMRPNI